jgi:3-dehydroquinate dehydratase
MTIPSVLQETHEIIGPISVNSLKSSKEKSNHEEVDIIDIRHDAVEINLKDEISQQLNPKSGLRQLPTLLLYSEKGLQLFEEVCVLDSKS